MVRCDGESKSDRGCQTGSAFRKNGLYGAITRPDQHAADHARNCLLTITRRRFMHPIKLFDCIEGQHWLLDRANRALYLNRLSERFGMRRYTFLRQEGHWNILTETKARRTTRL